jgi:shikimate kinase
MTEPRRITRDDLEARFRAVQTGATDKVRSKQQQIIAAGGTALFVLIVLTFLLGRRSGKRKTTIVEIRRV